MRAHKKRLHEPKNILYMSRGLKAPRSPAGKASANASVLSRHFVRGPVNEMTEGGSLKLEYYISGKEIIPDIISTY